MMPLTQITIRTLANWNSQRQAEMGKMSLDRQAMGLVIHNIVEHGEFGVLIKE